MRRSFSALLILVAVGCASGASADNCLKRTERQDAIAKKQAIRLKDALRSLWGSVTGRVVGAELCSAGSGLVYRIRLLEPGGKMRSALIDAKTGQVLAIK